MAARWRWWRSRCDRAHLRGPPPPPHPHVNPVLQQHVEGERAYVVRLLCDGGELFSALALAPALSEPEAMRWFVQIAGAVAHCHEHGAVHGQLRPENVLLRLESVQLVGFACCYGYCTEGSDAHEQLGALVGSGGSGDLGSLLQVDATPPSTFILDGFLGERQPPPPTLHTKAAMGASIELRPYDSVDAPELCGRRSALSGDLRACDVWALGMMLKALLKTRATSSPSSASTLQGSQPATNRGLQGLRRVGSVGSELARGLDGMLNMGEGRAGAGGKSNHTEGPSASSSEPAATATTGTGGLHRSRSVYSSIERAGVQVSSRAQDLVDWMLQPQPQRRPSAEQVLQLAQSLAPIACEA